MSTRRPPSCKEEMAAEDTITRHSTSPSFNDILGRRLSRRHLLKGSAAAALAASLPPQVPAAPDFSSSSLGFTELPHGLDNRLHVAEGGYRAQVLLRWGDPLFANAPAFNPARQSAAAQQRQFGYNCDFTAFMPLPARGGADLRGLLCVNHEYTSSRMFSHSPGLSREIRTGVELAAHGHTVVELRQRDAAWEVVTNSSLNRRISPLDTWMRLAGPAAGHSRLRTRADPEGTRVLGTLNNCAGGTTPWGTVLICEENFHSYFGGRLADPSEQENHQRYGVGPRSRYGWARFHPRFDLGREPREPNRFGWVVEIDPYDPTSIPVKRTALGRFRHESATVTLGQDGRVVVYSGDDQAFEYLYKFVSHGRYDPKTPSNNKDLLDEGVLYTARFDEDGRVHWLPLVYGEGPLTRENGFSSQAEVLIETRRAADLLGATPMDRPEGIALAPNSGRVYLALTKNPARKPWQRNSANPRAHNRHGHILELIPSEGTTGHSASKASWEIFAFGGKRVRDIPGLGPAGWFACPDNLACDDQDRLWIASDGATSASGIADGLWACDTRGPGRALSRHFLRAPRGAEVTGPCFTPDQRTLFLSIQHPGGNWPDFHPDAPPRPAVVAITRRDGDTIGS